MTTPTTPTTSATDERTVYDRLLAAGLSTARGQRAARSTWPLHAIEQEIARINADPKVRNLAAVLARRLSSTLPPAPVLTIASSQRSNLPAGDATGQYRPCRLSPAARDRVTDALNDLRHTDPARFAEFQRRALATLPPCQHDAPVRHDRTLMMTFGPILNLALDWGYVPPPHAATVEPDASSTTTRAPAAA